MPEMDGEEFTRIVRALADVPILAIGPAGDPELIVRVLDGGADDYLEQPVSEIELVGRLRAALRRVARQTAAERAPVVRTGALEVDLGERTLLKRTQVIPLTPTEWGLLAALAHRVGHVAPHRFLLSTVWGEEYVDDTHYLRIYIGYLRKKIEDNPSEPEYLLSQWGTGYRLADLPPTGGPPMLVPVRRSDEHGPDHRATG
jgi:two-component system KDP operon response regulator KdpE